MTHQLKLWQSFVKKNAICDNDIFPEVWIPKEAVLKLTFFFSIAIILTKSNGTWQKKNVSRFATNNFLLNYEKSKKVVVVSPLLTGKMQIIRTDTPMISQSTLKSLGD